MSHALQGGTPLFMLLIIFIYASCTSDNELEPAVAEPTGVPVELKSYVAGYQEPTAETRAGERPTPNPIPEQSSPTRSLSREGGEESSGETRAGVTRAWTVPTGFTATSGEFANKSISVFFTQETGEPEGGYEEEFFFVSSGKWRVSKTDLAAANYYLYGYVPHEKYVDASVTAPEGKTFADGATLTLRDLPSLTATDYCIIVGAKEGTNADTHNGLTRGLFTYAAQPTSGTGQGSNYVFLLFEHLYASLRVSMKMSTTKANGVTYYDLRTIKLKKLSLQTGIDNGTETVKTTKYSNATITLAKKDDGKSPITNVEFTSVPGAEEADGVIYENENGLELTTSDSEFMFYFMPQGINTLILTSVYDVYDKQGNLVRKDCMATNTIQLSEVFDQQYETYSGTRYSIYMTLRPSYLYVMSDPDAAIDKPEMVVE